MVFETPHRWLIADLRSFFEKSSGLDLALADPTTHFVELGLDSLVLTQAALELQATYKISISFRQLMGDFSTFASLSEYLLQNGVTPRPSPSTPLISAGHPSSSPDPTLFPHGSVEQLIASQLQMLSQQLQLLALSKTGAPTSPALPTTPAPSLSTPPQNLKPFGATPRISKSNEGTPSTVDQKELGEFLNRYITKTARSKEQTQRHRPYLADPRVVTGFSPTLKEVTYPIVVVRSSGSRMWDVDGNEYIDLLNGFGSNFFGHSAPYVKEAVSAQIERGVELGPMTPLAGEVASLMSELTGHARVAFCNTGSEAVMAAMRVARTVTGRKKIALFAGSYHGNFDEVVLRQVRGDQAMPASPGINPSMVENLTVLNYGTEEALAHLRERCGEYAAVLVEPVQSRRPDLQPREFLLELRAITEKAKTALISDEVICGFRVHPAGAQGYFGFKADLATYGKVAGGGYPIGLLAGSPQWMDAVDGGQWRYGDASVPEVGVMYLAGTFVRHPLALAAAKAALTHLKTQGPSLQTTLNERSARMVQDLNRFFESSNAPVHIKHFGSLMKIVIEDHVKHGELLFHALRMRGIHVLDVFPCFLSLAHSDADVQLIVKAFQESVSDLKRMGIFHQDDTPQKEVQSSGADSSPPVPGARLGRDQAGRPAWFIPDPKRPGRYMQIGEIQ